MYLFDLHCDTITRLHNGERLALGDNSLRQNGAHLALERMRAFQWCQCFAIFMPDELRGTAATDYFESNVHFFREQLAANADLIGQARNTAEMKQLLSAGKCAALLTVEGGSALAGDLTRIARLAACGVRVLTLTWNGENELAGGQSAGTGLTPLGRQAIPLLERAGIVVDVSHLSDKAFWEVAELADRPFIATHSNSRSICNHPRNLTDEQFQKIVSVGGLVGLNFCVSFITDQKIEPTFSHIAAHIEHFLTRGGENTLVLGADYDGADVPSWLDPAEKLAEFYPLVCREFGTAFADKLFFTNAYSFFSGLHD